MEEKSLAIYARKSRTTGRGDSVGSQVDLCLGYVKSRWGETGAEVYEDEGCSGRNLNRPAFQAMLKRARQGQVRAIIVYRLDRISRSVEDFTGLLAELNDLQVEFHSVKERFETETALGRAMMYLASIFSQLERETIGERIRDNMLELARAGRWLGGTAPMGYRSEAMEYLGPDGRKRQMYGLKSVPEEAEQVKRIFALFDRCRSLTQTVNELGKLGLRTRSGTAYSRSALRAILENPVYMTADGDAWAYWHRGQAELCAGIWAFDGRHGMLVYGRTEAGTRHGRARRPASDWVVTVGTHEGLIPGSTWLMVQRQLEENRTGVHPRARKHPVLLTGLLYCSCGAPMYPRLSGRVTPSGRPVFSYICKRKERSRGGACAVRNAGGNQLDRAVGDWMAGLEPDGALDCRKPDRASWAAYWREETTTMEKQDAVRVLVRRVIWDGAQADLFLSDGTGDILADSEPGRP